MNMLELHNAFMTSDLPNFEPDGKVGILATVDSQGLPHMTLITAMQAIDTKHLVFGQFCEGSGKQNAREHHAIGFLIMSLHKEVWRGKARWTHAAKTGAESEMFNQKPMWRYNSYFGIHTVHYMDLVGTTRKENLPMGRIIGGVFKGMLLSPSFYPKTKNHDEVMNKWTQRLISKTGALKFIAYIDSDGFPMIVPVLSAKAASTSEVIFPKAEYADELAQIPQGPVALYTMALSMETVLVRGTYIPKMTKYSLEAGRMTVNHVYNSMPPVPGTIYPKNNLNAVSTFS